MTLAFGLFVSFAANAQIINKNINFEIRLHELYYDGQNDGTGSNPGEVNVSIDISDPGGNWYNDICFDFSCPSVPYTYVNNDPNWFYLWGTGWSWNSEFNMNFTGWEDDNGETCNYNSTGSNPDDDYYNSLASFSGGGLASISQNAARWSSAWYSNDNSATGGWLLPNSNVWDIRLKTAWRYSSGDVCSDPLELGTLVNNQQYIHYNNTSRDIEGEHSGSAPLTYTNTADNPSADVYYRFELSTRMEVDINTISSQFTGYDTYLRLLNNNCGSVIAVNDDAGGTTQSQIIETLDPGIYLIQVEGYSGEEGTLRLNVKGTAVVSSLSSAIGAELVKIYPNPAKDVLHIDFLDQIDEDVTVKIYNLVGEAVYTSLHNQLNPLSISLNGIAPGNYIVELITDKEKMRNKIIIE